VPSLVTFDSKCTLESMLFAYIDESGTRDLNQVSSDHFVLSAVVLDPSDHSTLERDLLHLKQITGRRADHELSFKRLSEDDRAKVTEYLGQVSWPIVISVVVCKRYLGNTLPNDTERYLYTLRFLMERLSWLARDKRKVLHYTLAHIKGMKIERLRGYESQLRAMETQIAWNFLSEAGGRLDQPKRLPGLQIADLIASSTGIAFNPSPRTGKVHREFFDPLTRHLYKSSRGKLLSYGLKMHPWNENTKAAYPWVAALSERHVA
jgi:hypothetical protein